MTSETLLLYDLKKLREQFRPGCGDYDLLQTAGILRRLLLDSPRLVDEVNRNLPRLKITFRVSAEAVGRYQTNRSRTWFAFLFEGISPDILSDYPTPKGRLFK
jgi:hypothetical protein